MLQARIQIFRVLAYDYEVELGITTRHVRQRAHRTKVRIKIERFAQSDVDRSESFADRRRDRPFQSHLVALNRFDQFIRQGFAEFIECLLAGDVLFPFNFDAGCFDDAHDGSGDFRTNPVAGNQCDTMLHKSEVSRQ